MPPGPDTSAAPPLSSLTLVVPCHNEAANLPWLVESASTVLPTLAERCDLVVCDDGSDDGSADVARTAGAAHGLAVSVVRHEVKQGYGAAVGDGLRAARGDYVAFTDSDGQFDLADLARLVPLLDHADLVGGWRIERRDAAFRSVVSGVFNTLLRLVLGVRVRDVDCAMKLMRRQVLDGIDLQMRSAVLNAELYLRARRAGFRIAQVGVPHHPRRAGRRSGARPRAVLRAFRDILRLRLRLWREARAA